MAEKKKKEKKPSINIDFQKIQQDFQGLDPNDPGSWPLIPRMLVLVVIFVGVLGAAFYFDWKDLQESLERTRAEETQLRQQWVTKKRQAVNLSEHKRQLEEIDRQFGTLLRQLPNRAEMDALLSEINQAGIGRGLSFELFRPGGENTRDFYAEVPIALRITGTYDELGAFVGDVAKMPRIVSLRNITLEGQADGGMSMDAQAVTYRYLDEEEQATQAPAAPARRR